MNARLLVNIIILAQGNASLTSLREQGYTYAQIANAISDAEDMGFLELVNNKIRVTNTGKEYIEKINKTHSAGSGFWIVPQGKNYREPVDRDSIIFRKKK